MRKRDFFVQQPMPVIMPKVFGFETDVPAHSHGPALRPYWSVYYVTAGLGELEIGGRTYTVTPGSFFVIPPDTQVRYGGDPARPWDLIWAGFSLQGEAPAALRLPVVASPAARQIFEEMRRCCEMTDGKNEFLTGKLYELFALLEEQQPPRQLSYVEQAVACMEAEFMLDLTVGSLADRLGLDRSYFSTLFRAEKGVSPGRYLTGLRMENAGRLIREADQPVTTVAHSCGYDDPAVFARAFRRHFGVSPRQYRAQGREND